MNWYLAQKRMQMGKYNNSIYPEADTQFFVKKDVDKTVNASLGRAFGAATGTL